METNNSRQTITPEEANFGIIPGLNEHIPAVHDGGLTDQFAMVKWAEARGTANQQPAHYTRMLGSIAAQLNRRMSLPPSHAIEPAHAVHNADVYHETLAEVHEPRLQRLDHYKHQFMSLIGAAQRNGLPIDVQRTAAVMKDTKLSYGTKQSVSEHLAESHMRATGSHRPLAGQIVANTSEDPEADAFRLFHHYTRAISGGVAVKIPGAAYTSLSRGMKHGETEQAVNPKAPVKRAAFDEVVVDQITGLLYRAKETGVMPNFKKMTVSEFFASKDEHPTLTPENPGNPNTDILETMLSKTPSGEDPIKKLLAMQFEYYDPTKPPGQRAPARKEFWRMISRYTDLNRVDTAMSRTADRSQSHVRGYVNSPSYDMNVHAHGRIQYAKRGKLYSDGTHHQNRQFIKGVRAELDAGNDPIEKVEDLKSAGFTPEDIKLGNFPANFETTSAKRTRLLNEQIEAERKRAAATDPFQNPPAPR